MLIAGTKGVRIGSVYVCGILAVVVEREGEKDRFAGCEGGFLERKSAGDLCGAEVGARTATKNQRRGIVTLTPRSAELLRIYYGAGLLGCLFEFWLSPRQAGSNFCRASPIRGIYKMCD